MKTFDEAYSAASIEFQSANKRHLYECEEYDLRTTLGEKAIILNAGEVVCEKVKCRRCDGKGKTKDFDGGPGGTYSWATCDSCGGRGFVYNEVSS